MDARVKPGHDTGLETDMPHRPIIIDTDPGQDDALAILLALASPELEVLGLTTVGGNVPCRLTTRNALMLCELAGRRDLKVFAGSERPMVRKLETAEHIHGETGLNGADLPEPTLKPQPEHAVDWLVRTLMAAPARSITLVPIGPLTNIGMAMVREPRVVELIREIVIMGGAGIEGGNATPAAEFNIHVDPHAAHVVFTSGCPLTLVPLDVTHQVITTPERMDRLRAIGRPVTDCVVRMLDFFNRYDMGRYGFPGAPLHDPCTIAYLLEPSLFSGKTVNVEIDIYSPLTLGMTVIDWWGASDRAANCQVLRGVDAKGFYELLIGRLAQL
jgi:purine nucleosidase